MESDSITFSNCLKKHQSQQNYNTEERGGSEIKTETLFLLPCEQSPLFPFPQREKGKKTLQKRCHVFEVPIAPEFGLLKTSLASR